MINLSSQQLKAYFAMIAGTLIIGLSFVFVRISLRYADVSTLLAHRFSIAFLSMLAVYLITGRKFPQTLKKNWRSMLLLSIFYPFLFFSLQAVGLKYSTASEAGILSATTPIFTSVLAFSLLGERTTLKQGGCILLSVLGVAGMVLWGNEQTLEPSMLKGAFFILSSVMALVMYYVLGRKYSAEYDAMDMTFFMTTLAAIGFNAYAFYQHATQGSLRDYFSSFSEGDFVWAMLYLGILSSFLTSLFNNYSLTYLPASHVAIFNNLTPLITVIGGVTILDERLSTHQIIGGILVLLGVVGTLVFRTKSTANSPSSKGTTLSQSKKN